MADSGRGQMSPLLKVKQVLFVYYLDYSLDPFYDCGSSPISGKYSLNSDTCGLGMLQKFLVRLLGNTLGLYTFYLSPCDFTPVTFKDCLSHPPPYYR